MILFYDVETTGIPDFKARSHDPAQPHIVQLAMALYDERAVEVFHSSQIVKPEGWTISTEMAAIHGITQERALAEGVSEARATASFVVTQARCGMRVAHNESFDRRILRIAMTRAGYDRGFIELLENRPSFCTCEKSKSVVNLPPTERMIAAGIMGPKSPKLAECIKHFFGEELTGGHDALVDVRACARIYFHLNPPTVEAA